MKKTLGDKAIGIWKNYIAPSKEDIKKGKKELRIENSPEVPTEYKDGFIKELTMVQCRKTAKQCPLFMKGARKVSMDSIRAWFELETYNKQTKPAARDLEILRKFEVRTQFKKKWNKARVDSFVYGDGYLLITFENDKNTEIHDPPATKKDKEGNEISVAPWKVRLLKAENIKDIDFYPPEKQKYQKLFTRHFHYQDNETGKDWWIHPDRIVHIAEDTLSEKEFGNSKINLLRNIIKSMINIDIACGEILAWFAHGVFDIKQEGLNGTELEDKWKTTAKKHPGAWIHDETAEIKAVNPTAIDPEHFYNYLILKVASAFRMPTHVLTGVQVGKVTGAEVGMGDYVKTVKDDQDLMYTPLIELLYERILRAKGRKWKYNIVWNAIYIDELAEAEIMRKRTESATLAMNGQRGAGGFVDMKEARQIFNRGQVELDIDKKPKVPKPIQPPQPTAKPSDDDEDEESDIVQLKGRDADIADARRLGVSLDEYDKLPKTKSQEINIYTYQLDVADKAMIEKRKLQVEKERKLAKEQDDIDKSTS